MWQSFAAIGRDTEKETAAKRKGNMQRAALKRTQHHLIIFSCGCIQKTTKNTEKRHATDV